jgi:hypothetical protein
MSKEKKLTKSEIDLKAAELSVKLDNKVTPTYFETPDGEQIVGYCQEPEYQVLMYVVDMYTSREISKAAEALVTNCLIREESDKRILSDKRKDAKIRSSFTQSVLKLAIPYIDEYAVELKKK